MVPQNGSARKTGSLSGKRGRKQNMQYFTRGYMYKGDTLKGIKKTCEATVKLFE